MSAFAPGVTEKLGYYVYLLIDPRDDAMFYVGKGKGDRCFDHVNEARKTQQETLGDYPKLARIREIVSAGAVVRIDILRHGLSEPEAFLVESATIDLLNLLAQQQLKPQDLLIRTGGHHANAFGQMSISDINSLYGATPATIDPSHRVVLIRINRLWERNMSGVDLDEATRKWWKVGPIRRNLASSEAPQWAMAVFGGVVRAVYRIESWEPATAADYAAYPSRKGRWAFRGVQDDDMERQYLNRDVWKYLRSGVTNRAFQTPLRYVHCGPSQEIDTADALATETPSC